MERSIHRTLLLTCIAGLTACALAADLASAKGLGLAGPASGVAARDANYRYTAIAPAGRRRVTVVTKASVDGGRVVRWWHLAGAYQLPPMTYDGRAGGLSADGGTLVLSRFSRIYPPRRAGFAILDTRVRPRHPGSRRKHAVTRARLDGSFSFEAISPHGSTVYLLEHVEPFFGGPVRIRALDARSGRLSPHPIVDPRNRGRVTGVPVARSTSGDGRWAYTLFADPGHERGRWGEPFLSAIDTIDGHAIQVPLPELAARRNPYWLGLRPSEGGRVVRVLSRAHWIEGSHALFEVDLRSRAVGQPTGREADAGVALLWPLGGAAAVALALAASWNACRRRMPQGAREVDGDGAPTR